MDEQHEMSAGYWKARAETAEAERDECRRLMRDLLDAHEGGAEGERLSDAQDAAFAHLAGIPIIGYEELRARSERAEAALGAMLDWVEGIGTQHEHEPGKCRICDAVRASREVLSGR